MAQRAFVQSDIVELGSARRKPYVDIIQEQISKFPKGMNLSKTSIPHMQQLLLDPRLGFTTTKPAHSPVAESVPQSPSPNALAEFTAQANSNIPSDMESPASCKTVQLLIQDNRRPSAVFNTSQQITLTCVDFEDCGEGQWRASSAELFNKLQASFGRLEGIGKIGVADRENSKYTEFFVTFDTKHNSHIFSPNMTHIIVPRGNRLELRVDETQPTNSATTSSLGPPESTPIPSTPSKSSKIPEDEVLWLREQIEKCPGYATFDANRNKVLQNPDRVKFWQFSAQVVATFHKTAWPSAVSSTKAISKEAIQNALRVGSTSLTEAVAMTRIVEIYTKDGPNYSEEVVSEINRMQDSVDHVGAAALKLFLQEWAGSHPIARD
ncbi:hypothetical protein R3P38DRAFT_2811345 [Favolaschia claudopus]|uniref:Uncharacterized protein n=1 Tax=Favolaschia claudopus TaxID=2862362 RepID=A0AAV9Z8Z0_9AGAR